MKTLIAALAVTIGVAAPAAAQEYGYGGDYGGVVVAPVAPVVVAPVARVYVPPPPVYVAPVASVYAGPYYHRHHFGYGGGWGHAGWGRW